MIQDTTKITIEFVAPVNNTDGKIKITSNEYSEELTNEVSVQAVIWEAYKDTLINNIQYPVKGFENPIKIASTLNDLIEDKVNKIKDLVKQSGYDLGLKLGKILVPKSTKEYVELSIDLKMLVNIYSELINLEKEIKAWKDPNVMAESFLVDLAKVYPSHKWHIVHTIEPRQTIEDSTKKSLTFVGVPNYNKDNYSKSKWSFANLNDL